MGRRTNNKRKRIERQEEPKADTMQRKKRYVKSTAEKVEAKREQDKLSHRLVEGR